jgi:hypothetical protein
MKLNTLYFDSIGNEEVLEGDSVESIALQLPEAYSGGRLTVRDENGFVRGWVGSRTDWRAK